jgi:hypothetical protein
LTGYRRAALSMQMLSKPWSGGSTATADESL